MTADLQDLLRDSARRLPTSGPTDLDAVVRQGRALRARRRRRDVVLGLGSAAAVVALGVALVPGALGSRTLVGTAADTAVTQPPTSGPLVPLATTGAQVYVGVTPGASPEPVTGDLLARWVAQQVAQALPETAAVDIDGATIVGEPGADGGEIGSDRPAFGIVRTTLTLGDREVPLELRLGTSFSILCTGMPVPVNGAVQAQPLLCRQVDTMAGVTSYRQVVSDGPNARAVAAQAMDPREPGSGQSWTADAFLASVPKGEMALAGEWAEKAAIAAAQAITDRPYVGDPRWSDEHQPTPTPTTT